MPSSSSPSSSSSSSSLSSSLSSSFNAHQRLSRLSTWEWAWVVRTVSLWVSCCGCSAAVSRSRSNIGCTSTRLLHLSGGRGTVVLHAHTPHTHTPHTHPPRTHLMYTLHIQCTPHTPSTHTLHLRMYTLHTHLHTPTLFTHPHFMHPHSSHTHLSPLPSLPLTEKV